MWYRPTGFGNMPQRVCFVWRGATSHNDPLLGTPLFSIGKEQNIRRLFSSLIVQYTIVELRLTISHSRTLWNPSRDWALRKNYYHRYCSHEGRFSREVLDICWWKLDAVFMRSFSLWIGLRGQVAFTPHMPEHFFTMRQGRSLVNSFHSRKCPFLSRYIHCEASKSEAKNNPNDQTI